MRLFQFLILAGFVLFGVACAPNKRLANPKVIQEQVKGHLCRIYLEGNRSSSGELISVNATEIVLLQFSDTVAKTTNIPMKTVRQAEVFIASTSDNAKAISLWATINPIMTPFHGFWSIFSLPANLIVSIPTGNDAASGRYVVKFPKAGSYLEMAKFARFPGGLPPGLDLHKLK